MAHDEESNVIEYVLGAFMVLLNAMLNPILYALWYPEFRKYLVKIPGWFKPKKNQPHHSNFEIQSVKILSDQQFCLTYDSESNFP